MPREKHVYRSNEIAHLWYHKTQDDARNQQGNFYFQGATIYSYGSHFPIARHVTNNRGESAVLFTTREYRVTTSKHLSLVRRAIPDSATVFNVVLSSRSYHDDAPLANIQDYTDRIRNTEAKARKARSHMRYELTTLETLVDEANSYAAFYDLPQRFSLPSDIESLRVKAGEYAAKADTARMVRNAARSAEWEKRNAEYEAAQKRTAEENLAIWLAGGSVPYYDTMSWDQTYLRIAGTNVETSKGAVFPITHALVGLAFVRKVRERGEAYKRNGHTIHLGNYAIDAIDAQGNVTAGCHFVLYEEIERIAPQLEACAEIMAARSYILPIDIVKALM